MALTTFSDLVTEARARVERDAIVAGLPDDSTPLRDGGTGATAYAEAVGVYLAVAVDNGCYEQNRNARRYETWAEVLENTIRNTFARQAIPMTWDYAEAIPFRTRAGGDFLGAGNWIEKEDARSALDAPNMLERSTQADAHRQDVFTEIKVVSTDPPYYDNIGYADLSDFFYVWLRRSLKLVSSRTCLPRSPSRRPKNWSPLPTGMGARKRRRPFFLTGMTQAMRRLAEQAHPGFPVTIYYAFKQSETKGDTRYFQHRLGNLPGCRDRGRLLDHRHVADAHRERGNRIVGMGTNALASSIVLVCRQRPADAPMATRREFVAALKSELPVALTHLQRGNIAPVDLAQAAIGPGMAVYTRYAKVLDATGKALPVRDALALINQTLDEALAEQEGDFDADSRWALAWFEQSGFDEGEYGIAEMLSKAKNTSVAGMVDAGILASKGGTVRLLKPEELPPDWNPTTDPRLTAWEMVHHLVRALEAGGESAAAELAAPLGAKAEAARELCYRLYTLCERKKRAAEALSYNSLVQSWPEISRLVSEEQEHEVKQPSLFANEDG